MTSRSVTLQTQKIVAEVERGVGWLSFNNPERRNAVSLEIWQGLADATAAFKSDAEVRVVLRGAGGQSFAAGADISEFEQFRANAEQKKQYGEIASRGQQGLSRLFERYSTPPTAAADEIAALVDGCFDSADYQEGRRAFIAKRTPQFEGR